MGDNGEKKNLIIQGPFFDISGYATKIRNFTLRLIKRGEFNIRLFRRDWWHPAFITENSEDIKLLHEYCNKDKPHPNESIVLDAGLPIEFYPHGKYNIGYTVLETDRITPKWAELCNRMDMILVPTIFNVITFKNHGVRKPVLVQPEGVDFDLFSENGSEPLLSFENKFVFLTVGQWLASDRKGMENTIRTFISTFRDQRDVVLVVKTYNNDASAVDRRSCRDIIKSLRAQYGNPKYPEIHLVHGILSQQDMARLYKSADALVLATRGEGWSLPVVESVASGAYVIVTGGTGPATYLDPDCSTILNYQWQNIPPNCYWENVYHMDHMWTEPDWKQVGEKMFWCYKNPELIKQKAAQQRQKLVDKGFSWEDSTTKLSNLLKGLKV